MKRIIDAIARLVWAVKNFKCLDELLALKDLQDRGLLAKLPVAIGTPVFFIDMDEETLEWRVTEETFDYIMIGGWGKWVFVTEHEATLKKEKLMGGEMYYMDVLHDTCEKEYLSKRISHNALCDEKCENRAMKRLQVLTLILAVISLVLTVFVTLCEFAVILYD